MPPEPRSADAAELSRLPMPNGADGHAAPTLAESPETEATAPTIAPPGAVDHDLDSVVARLVLQRGLAVQSEVDECFKRLGDRRFRRRTLADLLVSKGFVTATQMSRLREEINTERTGYRIPGFRMIGKLGQGASAAVFKARQLNLDRLVAIKVLPRRAGADPRLASELASEARAAAQLNHPNVVQAYDVGQAAGFHYFVMEYVEGKTVHDILMEQGRIEEEAALDIMVAIADALAHAHRKGLIHRDVKPKNIILTDAGIPKLADLGLARIIADRDQALRERGKTLGTPYYISPEQVRGDEHIGPETDIYSLGASFYFMVTGRVPFEGDDSRAVMDKHLAEPLEPPSKILPGITHGVSEVIERMLAKEPSARYRTCDELLVDLRAWKAYFVLKRGESSR